MNSKFYLCSPTPLSIMSHHRVGNTSIHPTTHSQAYSQLVSIHERDHTDKVGNLLFAKVKGLPGGKR